MLFRHLQVSLCSYCALDMFLIVASRHVASYSAFLTAFLTAHTIAVDYIPSCPALRVIVTVNELSVTELKAQ